MVCVFGRGDWGRWRGVCLCAWSPSSRSLITRSLFHEQASRGTVFFKYSGPRARLAGVGAEREGAAVLSPGPLGWGCPWPRVAYSGTLATHTHTLTLTLLSNSELQGAKGVCGSRSQHQIPSPYKPLTVGQVTSRLQTESPEIEALVDEIRKITISDPEEGEETGRSSPLQTHTSSPRPFSFQVTMSAGNVTPWGSSAAGEEVWVGSGVEVEGAELPTFSVAAKVRVGVTVVLFVSSAGGNLAVVWSGTRPQPSQLRPSPVRRLFAHLAVADLLVTFMVMPLVATWNITVQWLAGDFACRTLTFLKLVAM